jgi:nickel transport protein
MPRPALPALIGAAALLLAPALPTPARAHAIQTNLERLDALSASLGKAPSGAPAGFIRLETSFSSGQPVASAQVRLLPPDGGAAIEVGRTDGEGRLTFPLPKQARADWELQVDGGPGHRDYLELPSAATPALHSAQPVGERFPIPRAPGGLALLGGLSLAGLGGLARLCRRP